MLIFAFIACATTSPETTPAEPPAAEEPAPDVKAPGNLPVMTEAELVAAEAQLQSCIDDCVKANQMRAVSPQEIRVDCERGCNEEHFIGQVEVIDAPGLPVDEVPE